MPKAKKQDFVTKTMLDEAVDTILKGVDGLIKQLRIDLKKEMRVEFRKELRDELEPIRADVTFIKDDIRGIKADLSDTPSRRQFNQLKARVDKYHPQS